MDWDKVLSMPLKMFWSFQKQIDRLKADDDLKLFQCLNLSQSQDANGVKAYVSSLKERVGNPAHAEAAFDEDKYLRMAAQFGQKVDKEDG